jgi:hypothetical protein
MHAYLHESTDTSVVETSEKNVEGKMNRKKIA